MAEQLGKFDPILFTGEVGRIEVALTREIQPPIAHIFRTAENGDLSVASLGDTETPRPTLYNRSVAGILLLTHISTIEFTFVGTHVFPAGLEGKKLFVYVGDRVWEIEAIYPYLPVQATRRVIKCVGLPQDLITELAATGDGTHIQFVFADSYVSAREYNDAEVAITDSAIPGTVAGWVVRSDILAGASGEQQFKMFRRDSTHPNEDLSGNGYDLSGRGIITERNGEPTFEITAIPPVAVAENPEEYSVYVAINDGQYWEYRVGSGIDSIKLDNSVAGEITARALARNPAGNDRLWFVLAPRGAMGVVPPVNEYFDYGMYGILSAWSAPANLFTGSNPSFIFLTDSNNRVDGGPRLLSATFFALSGGGLTCSVGVDGEAGSLIAIQDRVDRDGEEPALSIYMSNSNGPLLEFPVTSAANTFSTITTLQSNLVIAGTGLVFTDTTPDRFSVFIAPSRQAGGTNIYQEVERDPNAPTYDGGFEVGIDASPSVGATSYSQLVITESGEYLFPWTATKARVKIISGQGGQSGDGGQGGQGGQASGGQDATFIVPGEEGLVGEDGVLAQQGGASSLLVPNIGEFASTPGLPQTPGEGGGGGLGGGTGFYPTRQIGLVAGEYYRDVLFGDSVTDGEFRFVSPVEGVGGESSVVENIVKTPPPTEYKTDPTARAFEAGVLGGYGKRARRGTRPVEVVVVEGLTLGKSLFATIGEGGDGGAGGVGGLGGAGGESTDLNVFSGKLGVSGQLGRYGSTGTNGAIVITPIYDTEDELTDLEDVVGGWSFNASAQLHGHFGVRFSNSANAVDVTGNGNTLNPLGFAFYPRSETNDVFLGLTVPADIQANEGDYSLYISVDGDDYVEFDLHSAGPELINLRGEGLRNLLNALGQRNHISMFIATAGQGARNGTNTYVPPTTLRPSTILGRWRFFGRTEINPIDDRIDLNQFTESASAYDISDNGSTLHSNGVRFEREGDKMLIDVATLPDGLTALAGQPGLVDGLSVYIAIGGTDYVEHSFSITQEGDLYRLTIESDNDNASLLYARYDTEVNIVLAADHVQPLLEKDAYDIFVPRTDPFAEPTIPPIDDPALTIIPDAGFKVGSLVGAVGGWEVDASRVSKTTTNNVEKVSFSDSPLSEDKSGNRQDLLVGGIEYVLDAGEVRVHTTSTILDAVSSRNLSIYVNVEGTNFFEFPISQAGGSSFVSGEKMGAAIESLNAVAGSNRIITFVIASSEQDAATTTPTNYNRPVYTQGEVSLGYTAAFSTNPALILLDYLLDGEFGANMQVNDIDLDSFGIAARICDKTVFDARVYGRLYESIALKTRPLKKYEFSGSISTDAQIQDNVQSILGSMHGALITNRDGKLAINLPDEDTSTAGHVVAEITDDYLAGNITVSIPDTDSRFNTCTVSYPNISDDFAEDTYTYKNTAYLLADKSGAPGTPDNKLEEELSPSGLNSFYHAWSRAKYTTDISRATQYSFTVINKGAILERGDVVRLRSKEQDIKAFVRIHKITQKTSGTSEIEGLLFDIEQFRWKAEHNENVTVGTGTDGGLVVSPINYIGLIPLPRLRL